MSREDEPRYLIFDLDGVITTEHIYWECARLTIWEMLQLSSRLVVPYVPAVHDESLRSEVIPETLVYAVKDRAINSNWDLTFIVACSVFAALPQGLGQPVRSVPQLLTLLSDVKAGSLVWCEPVWALLEKAGMRQGAELLLFAGQQAAMSLGADTMLFEPEGALWQYLYERFQVWYSGTAMAAWGAPRLPERPVLPIEQMQSILSGLRDQGYTLCAATGRPQDEAMFALRSFGLDSIFDLDRVATYDDVMEAQAVCNQTGLGKPHPYVLYKALWPEQDVELLLEMDRPKLPPVVMVGDSSSDARAAQAAGVDCFGVLSGVVGDDARRRRRDALLGAGCAIVHDDITTLPEWLAARF